MKEFIEKLIDRLEESEERYDDVSFAQLNEFGHTLDYEYAKGKRDGVAESKEIVNQLAEEYKSNDNVIQFAKLLKEICCKKDADYDKSIISPKFLCDTVDTLVMDFIPQNNGWIPCSEKLPENGKYLVCDDKGNIYESAYCFGAWLVRSDTTEVIAWQQLPPAYQPKAM